jgi:RNA polymerase sigma-70 factor (ECF subfamily)
MDPRDEELVNLIARCAIRDQQALKQLFDRLGPYLHAVAFRILKSGDLSNDTLQEAFVQIWNNAASYRPDRAKPLTWITSILRYRALDRLDKERKHTNHLIAEADVEEQALESGETPERALQQTQLRYQIERCLEMLSQDSRRCIRLAYLEGYSREEIATRLATNINTVKSWLRRGSERLRRCLEASSGTI